MALLTLKNLSIAYGVHELLDQANLVLDAGERVGLLGRNGEGKSTLLKIIAGTVKADGGEITGIDGIRIAKLDQAPSLTGDSSIYDVVASGLGSVGDHLAEYRQLINDPESNANRLGDLQSLIDNEHGWSHLNIIEQVISKLGLNPDQAVAELSGGWQRRVSLARALATEPDVLLLDEPTNHLDIQSIQWLEGHLKQFRGAVLFVTHDRAFLDQVATRIVDLDRGQLISWPGNYLDYQRRKAAALEEESQQNREFDKKLAQEEAWIRQGIKARRTRNEGRVRALQKLRDQHAQRRQRQGNAKFSLDSGNKSGKRVIEAEDICFGWDDKPIVDQFSTTIMRGDRIGLIGDNGMGKSTLIKILLGEIKPDSGSIKLGTNLAVAHFDQLRDQLAPEKTVVDFIGEGRDQITIGDRSRHVISYLSDFLFTPKRARSPINSLSGGERARVLLAYLFSKPVNFLVMDEPTNDLDIETLELLEERLLDFDGTLLLVSHDRAFMDNVVTSTLAFEGNGHIQEYVGGYGDWLRQTKSLVSKNKVKPTTKATPKPNKPSKKLSYQLQRELDTLPELIGDLEAQQQTLTEALSAPDIYQGSPDQAAELNQQLSDISAQLEQAFLRWEELDT